MVSNDDRREKVNVELMNAVLIISIGFTAIAGIFIALILSKDDNVAIRDFLKSNGGQNLGVLGATVGLGIIVCVFSLFWFTITSDPKNLSTSSNIFKALTLVFLGIQTGALLTPIYFSVRALYRFSKSK
jgi:hypothetical protein